MRKNVQWSDWTERTGGHKLKIKSEWSEWTKWTQIQNKIMRKNVCNGQIGQNGQSGHKLKIKS